MNRGEAVAAIKRRLGYYEKKDADIVSELTISQRQLENGVKLPPRNGQDGGIFMPWFLTSEIQSATTTIGEPRVAVPAAVASTHDGFLSEVEDAALWILDPDADADDPWLELKKMPFDQIVQKYPGTDIPKAYDLIGSYFRLGPTPDAVYNLKLITCNRDLIPSADDKTNKWLTHAPEVLWAHCGLSMATSLRDQGALTIFKQTFIDGVWSLFFNTESRLHTNRRYVMGGDD